MPSSAWKGRASDRKSTRLNSSHLVISYAVFCLEQKSVVRSEEHTSELQSPCNLVCRLLLATTTYYVGKDDKKKNIHRFPDSKDSDQWGVNPNDGYEVKLTDEFFFNYSESTRLRPFVPQHGLPA